MGAAASSSRLGDNDHGNTSQDNHLRSNDRDSEGPIDTLSVPNTEQTIEKGENAQAIHDSEQMEKKRRAIERIVAWFSEAGIPFNTARIESFDLMLEATAQCGPGLQVRSLDELDGPLQRQLLAINGSIEALKKYWMSEGCSILAFIDLGDDGRQMLSLTVDCSHGVSFLRSIELPSGSYDEAFVCRLVDSCIEEIGEKNVVQVIGNVGIGKTGAKLPRKRPNIFWTQCAASSIDMMLEDIGHICLIKKTIAKARSLTAFIYAQTNLLDMTRKFTNQQDLVHVGITYYTTCCLNLRSLYDKRIELKTMFISKEWEDSKWSKEAVGKKFYNLVVSNEFWHNVLYAINSFEPLVEVLRRMGSGRPSMGYIYGELVNVKKEIAFRFGNKEEYYLPVWHHIDFRINLYMMKPLHLAAYYLNPSFYYQNRHEIENTEIFRDALLECACKMYQDESTQEKIVHQLKLYSTDSQSFGMVHAISTRMDVDPVSWWQLHDGTAKELSAMALRILRLTCGSLAYEPSWIEMIHKEKPSWIKNKQFEDSMFVTVNRRIQGKAQMRDRDPVLAYLPRDDEPFEWLVGMFSNEAQRQDNRDLLMARARSSDGIGLAKLANKLFIEADYVTSDEESDEKAPTQSIKRKTSSSASCSKREKRPWLVKGNLKDDECEGSDGNIRCSWTCSSCCSCYYNSSAAPRQIGSRRVIVFGDSTADTGNNNFIQTLLRGNYTPYGRDFAGGVATGRLSNGRLAADFVSQRLGLPPAVPAYLDPGHGIHQLASGVSFASAGSGFDDITAQIFSAVTLTQQIEHFKEYKEKLRRGLGGAAADHIVASSLYLFSVGGSDFLGNYLLFPIRRARFTLLEYEAYLVGAAEAAVRAVYALGARRVRLPGLPPLGCLPLQRTVNLAAPGDCNRWHNMVARRFNRGLRAMASRLSRELPGAQVVYVDVYRLLADVIARPWAYGFENSVRGCCGTGYFETGVLCSLDNALTCEDADKYVFFDAVHPSQRAYKIIADAIVHAASHRSTRV